MAIRKRRVSRSALEKEVRQRDRRVTYRALKRKYESEDKRCQE